MAEPTELAADAAQPRRRRPSGRVRVAAIGAGLAVLVVAGGVAWVTNDHAARAADVAGHGSSPRQRRSVTPTDVPDGWRLVSNEGLEFAIPKSWPLISIGCDVPMRSTVIVTGGAGPSCGWIEPPKVTHRPEWRIMDAATVQVRSLTTPRRATSRRVPST